MPAANGFTARTNRSITAVGFYTLSSGTPFEVSAAQPQDAHPARHGHGDAAGIRDRQARHAAGGDQDARFVVAIKLVSPDGSLPLAIERFSSAWTARYVLAATTADRGRRYVGSKRWRMKDLTSASPQGERVPEGVRALRSVGTAPTATRRKERGHARDPSQPPAGRGRRSGARPFRLRAVLFDFDGTLTRPGALDFAAIKRQVGCPPDRFVLEWDQGTAGRRRARRRGGGPRALRARRRRRIRAQRRCGGGRPCPSRGWRRDRRADAQREDGRRPRLAAVPPRSRPPISTSSSPATTASRPSRRQTASCTPPR